MPILYQLPDAKRYGQGALYHPIFRCVACRRDIPNASMKIVFDDPYEPGLVLVGDLYYQREGFEPAGAILPGYDLIKAGELFWIIAKGHASVLLAEERR